jgi:hypothetical protein
MNKYFPGPVFSPLSKAELAAIQRVLGQMRACAALATNINFDDVSEGTVINNTYSAKGVIFSNPIAAGGNGNVYARNSWNNPDSSPNCVSVSQTGLPCFDESTGIVEAKFSKAQVTVSIDAIPLAWPDCYGQPVQTKPYMEIYDTKGLLLQRIYYPADYGQPQWGTWQKLEYVSSSVNIGSIRFASQRLYPWVYATFDNLHFSPCSLGMIIQKRIKA